MNSRHKAQIRGAIWIEHDAQRIAYYLAAAGDRQSLFILVYWWWKNVSQIMQIIYFLFLFAKAFPIEIDIGEGLNSMGNEQAHFQSLFITRNKIIEMVDEMTSSMYIM